MPNCDKGRMGMGGYRSLKGVEYHLFAECPYGDAIPDEECRPGSGGLPLCPTCHNIGDKMREKRRRKHYGPG
jgi:hypothetical protein